MDVADKFIPTSLGASVELEESFATAIKCHEQHRFKVIDLARNMLATLAALAEGHWKSNRYSTAINPTIRLLLAPENNNATYAQR